MSTTKLVNIFNGLRCVFFYWKWISKHNFFFYLFYEALKIDRHVDANGKTGIFSVKMHLFSHGTNEGDLLSLDTTLIKQRTPPQVVAL